jgi:hypothetical protein
MEGRGTGGRRGYVAGEGASEEIERGRINGRTTGVQAGLFRRWKGETA